MTTSSQPVTQARERERFPILQTATYLVSHSMGAAPLAARAALEEYWQAWATDGPEAWDAWLPAMRDIANGIASLLGAATDSVSLVPNVSLAQSALATALDFSSDRNEVVLEDLQFPSVTYVWTAWERFGAKVVRVPSRDGRTVSTDALCSAITERTAIAVLSHAAYQSGAVIDIAAVQARCRETGTIFALDAYQTVGIVPLDVAALDLDVLAGGSHKWLCGGPGCGFLYIAPRLRDRLAPAQTGWMAHETPFAFEPAPIKLATTAHRWNSGTPTIPGYLVARAGHDLIRELGVGAIRAHNLRLTERLFSAATERGWTVPTPRSAEERTGWVGIDFPGADRVARRLLERRIFIDYRPGCGIRVSPHFYTTDDEIEVFIDAVDELSAGPFSRR